MKQIFMKIDKLLGRLFWPLIAVIVAKIAYDAIRDYGKPYSGTMDFYIIDCVDARNERVDFMGLEHKVFVDSGKTGLTAVKDRKTILYDYEELSKTPSEYREFVLRVACARNADLDLDAQAADCNVVKRLRDEKAYSKEHVALIAQSLPTSSEGADDREARTRNLYACFDAPK